MSNRKVHSHWSKTKYNKKDEWRTNVDFYDVLNREFRFNYDFAASKMNHFTKRYFTKENSALEQENWFYDKKVYPVGFLNPPFTLFDEFLKKASIEVQKDPRNIICCLIRGDSPETKWFRENLINPLDGLPNHEIRNYYPRVKFREPNGNIAPNVGFPTAIVVMRAKRSTRVIWKTWKEEDLQIPFDFIMKHAYKSTTFSEGGI